MKWIPEGRDTRDWLMLAATMLGVMGILAYTSAQSGVIQWNYLAGLLITITIYAVFALGLSLEFGSTGLLNFGHVGFAAIGAYTYGILMMRPRDRPTDAAAVVGKLYDAAEALQGATAWGILVCVVIGLLAGALLSVPLLVALGRFGTKLSPTVRLAIGIGAGLVLAGIVFSAIFPLDGTTSLNAAALMAMLAGMLLAALAGLLLGLPTIRLREDYLAIVTIGAAEILRSVILNEEAWTRGSKSILSFQRPIIEWSLNTGWWREVADNASVKPASLAILALSIATLIFVIFLLQTLAKSPWGRVMRAIREDEEAAASLGKNVLWYKLQSLMVGSAIAAAAGILLVTSLSIISHVTFVPILTFYAFIIVVIGGVGNHKGTIAGAFILWGIFALSQNLPPALRLEAGPQQGIFIGALLVVIMLFRPQGLLGRKEELVHAK